MLNEFGGLAMPYLYFWDLYSAMCLGCDDMGNNNNCDLGFKNFGKETRKVI